MPKGNIGHLQGLELFKGMTPEAMDALGQNVRRVSFRRKSILFLPGDPGQCVYVLKAGRVKIAGISKSGRVVTLAVLEPGEIFGEMDLLADTSRSDMAEALEETKLYVIPKNYFLSLLREHPEVSFRLTKIVCSRAKRVESRVEDLVFLDVSSRLIRLLTALSKDHGTIIPGGIRLDLKFTHQELADRIGSIRETVSATLGRFKRAGLIDYDGRRIVLLHPDCPKLKDEPFPPHSAQIM